MAFERIKNIANEAMKLGKDDPRRIVHSMKVGLALTLVSFLYYFRPLYDGFGQAGMWAILTVVVVFEYTVGGTLSKCINRGCATLMAGALGIGAEYFADVSGKKGEPVILGILVFVLAAVATFMRFFPKVKRRYDYGVLIFILTFSLVAVSGYRVTQIVELAHQRLSTILIGGATCIVISISVCPVWAGRDLHFLIAGNIDKLAVFLQGFGDELEIEGGGEENDVVPIASSEKGYLQSHKSVLNSKATEESLANFAWWEPWHGRFKFCHPWKQYLKIGCQIRECAFLIETLIGYIHSKSPPKATSSSQVQTKIRQPCVKICHESSKALKDLSSAIRHMSFPAPPQAASVAVAAAVDDLKAIFQTSSLPTKDAGDFQQVLPLLLTASILMDIVDAVDKIGVSVHELAQKAGFQKNATKANKQHSGIVKPVDKNEGDQDRVVVIQVDRPEKKTVPETAAGD